jgi:hypothetical protein
MGKCKAVMDSQKITKIRVKAETPKETSPEKPSAK